MTDQELISDLLLRYSWLLPILAIWVITWKGIALWRAAQLKSKVWFVILLIFNTLGILEIIYLLATQKQSKAIENKTM